MNTHNRAPDEYSVFTPPLPQKPGDKIRWGALSGNAGALAISHAAGNLPGVSLIITPSTAEADRLEQEFQLFLEGRPDAPALLHFSDWETLPYDSFSPHQDIISARMRTLYRLSQGQRAIVLVSAQTLVQRIAPREYILANSLVLNKGDRVNLEQLRIQLTGAGYQAVDTVFQHGEFALRGGLIDIFPMGSDAAFRIELFDDEVESLRQFDPDSQRTVTQVSHIDLLPARECPTDKATIARFKNNWHSHFDVDVRACPAYQDVASGLSPAGVEYFLPLFFEHSASLFSYLPEQTTVFVTGDLEEAIEHYWREVVNRYESRRGDITRPVLPPNEIFLSANEVFTHLKPLARVTLSEAPLPPKAGHHNFACAPPPELQINAQSSQPLAALEHFLMETDHRILFCAESSGRREALLEQLARLGLSPEPVAHFHEFASGDQAYAITIAPTTQGLISTRDRLTVIAEAQLFGLRIQQRRRRRSSSQDDRDNIIKNLTELKIGAPVVHIDNGIGRYQGLQTLEVDGQAEEFLVLEYADHAKLYVPVANLQVISRYSGGDDSHVPLHRLGSEQWQRAKRKAAEKIHDVAAELLVIYAKRKARRGDVFQDPKEAYAQFAASFPFEETPDQQAAIEAVRQDLLSPQPMDRLVCGDVGFGKTEVAMRAAFIAVQNNRQAVILVPTTLLAQQHHENFKDRFADWPVNVDVISRFRSDKDIQNIQKKLEAGQIDILIGTHKLLQGGLEYPRLGLLIIDEEHRFGVRQKEKLKALRAEVNILTMTATPIPRTLNMAMNSIRDLSVIATPPAKRLSIKTFVRERDINVIKEAILREILRGGQVYFLHNEVKTIEQSARELQELVPEARIRVGHGQMRERELEAVMSDFYHKRFNVLVCTTIIETGIDVPSANTIIIERADKFGLAQLHQLRGRVGRSHHQAYAYLLTAPAKSMTADAHKRLNAIAEAQDLGAGFMLASHDLEIRGAGELLGEEQSGHIQAIGFSLYMDLLDRAVKAMQRGETLDVEQPMVSGPEINLRIPALIPDDYLPDVHSRLILYKRIASVPNQEALEELQVEMIDRFGLLPAATRNLMQVTELKLRAQTLGIVKIEANASFGRLEFGPKANVEPINIVKLVQTQPQRYRLEGATQVKFMADMEASDARLQEVDTLLNTLAQSV